MAKTISLRARKSFTYATRRLLPGDLFDAPKRHARLLIAAKRASEIREPASLPAPPPALVEAAAAPSDIAALRAEYERAIGRRPFPGWSADSLREKIAAARTTP